MRGAVPTSFKSLVSFEDLSCLYMISGSGERKEKTKKQKERERGGRGGMPYIYSWLIL